MLNVVVKSEKFQTWKMTTLVRKIVTGYIVAGKKNGGYRYGGIAEKPPNLTHHN